MIGIFDSGIGGLTVVKELLRQRPDVAFVYLGDTARAPYGNKNPETVIRYTVEDAAFLISRGATCLVVACNSMSAVALEALRAAYPNVPLFEVITPAVEAALRVGAHARVGVIGTRATIASSAYERALRARGIQNISAQACPLFAPLVEEGWFEAAETKRIARRYLSPLRQAQLDVLILGCTHYPLLAPVIQRYMGRQVKLIDSGAAVVASFVDMASEHLRPGEQRYFMSDVSLHTQNIARSWLKREIVLEKAEI